MLGNPIMQQTSPNLTLNDGLNTGFLSWRLVLDLQTNSSWEAMPTPSAYHDGFIPHSKQIHPGKLFRGYSVWIRYSTLRCCFFLMISFPSAKSKLLIFGKFANTQPNNFALGWQQLEESSLFFLGTSFWACGASSRNLGWWFLGRCSRCGAIELEFNQIWGNITTHTHSDTQDYFWSITPNIKVTVNRNRWHTYRL